MKRYLTTIVLLAMTISLFACNQAASPKSEATSDEGWVYFQNRDDGGKLYRKKTDGTEVTKICDDRIVVTFSEAGGWLYYIYQDGDFGNFKLYKIKGDGTSRQKVCDAYFIELTPDDDVTSYIEGGYIVINIEPLTQPALTDEQRLEDEEMIKNRILHYRISLDGLYEKD